ncbi:MAG: bifunctional pyr operon transcriptional regulator/uracil phosphoribosyltransferase PyrR [Filifactoraceae bacterium]
MSEKILIMDKNAANRALTRISHEIVERNKGIEDIVIIGIRKRGLPVANSISQKVMSIENTEIPVGSIDVTMYRDDVCKEGIDKILSVNNLGIDIEGKTIILVDDVLYTGRTVRSALDAIIDIARPKAIQLAVLVDRGHRELPIRADYVGKNVPTSRAEIIKVNFDSEKDEISVTLNKILK